MTIADCLTEAQAAAVVAEARDAVERAELRLQRAGWRDLAKQVYTCRLRLSEAMRTTATQRQRPEQEKT